MIFLFLFTLSCAAAICVALIYATKGTVLLNRRNDLSAVQASHTKQVSRLGGVAIVVAAAVSVPFIADPEARMIGTGLFLSVLPVFIAGLAEDLGFDVSPKKRLFGAALSSALAIVVTGAWINSSGIGAIDVVLGVVPIGLVITIIWTSGLCHATNLIDGMNGLAGAFTVLAAAGLAILAYTAGDYPMVALSLVIIPAVLGFMLFNWPGGLIFLGDAGAYSLGHLVAWLGIILAARNADIAGTAVALVFFWPIADTTFAIYRRRRQGKRFDQPDRMHVHQIVMRWLEIAGLGRKRRHISNPATTVVLLPFMSGPIILATLMPEHGGLALLTFGLCAAGFVTVYILGTKFARSRRNPVDVVRPVRTVPVSEPHLPTEGEANPALVVEVRDDILLMRSGPNSYWYAFVRGPSGTWRKLDRGFTSRDRAVRSAMRTRFRNRLSPIQHEHAAIH